MSVAQASVPPEPVAAPTPPPPVGPFEARITPGYITLRAINVGVPRIRAGYITTGKVTVLLQGDESFSAQGTLNNQGVLSGMSKLHARLGLKDGDVIEFSIPRPGIEALIVVKPSGSVPAPEPSAPEPTGSPAGIFAKLNLRHIHIEPFRPEGLNTWEPRTEPDVYMAFGVLQENTDFKYCCGASIEILNKLGADYSGRTKPDAILIDRVTDEYLMAEWKMKSSDFKSNHRPDDVDVLVCWIDDETDRSTLPPRTVALYEVARIAATQALAEE